MDFSAILVLLYSNLCFCDIVIALLGLFTFSCIQQRLTNKGPMLWPVMGIIPALFFHINDVFGWSTRALIKAGGTFSFRGMWMGGAHGVVTADPSNIEYILKTRFKNFPKGKYYRERFYDLLGDGIFNVDDELWKVQRQLATHEMHSNLFIKHSFQATKDLVHQKLLKLMQKVVDSGDIIDLQETLLQFTLDNICIAAFGTDPCCLGLNLPQIPFARAFEEATELSLFRFMVPPFVWKPMQFLGIGYEKRLKEAVKLVHAFADKTVKDRRNELVEHGSLSDRSDILSKLINRQNQLSDKFLRDFCINLILAGRDTSSVALTWFFWLIQNNPSVENGILREINKILEERSEGFTEEDVSFTEKELKKMVYLEAALKEAMRLYPPVAIELKEVVEEDVIPSGAMLKKGARVLINLFSMARMEKVWGEDCSEFKPERWIEEGEVVEEKQYKYAVFNGGPRLCLGKKMAWMQMKMVSASILVRYRVEAVKCQTIIPKLTTTLYMKNGFLATLHPRTPSNGVAMAGSSSRASGSSASTQSAVQNRHDLKLNPCFHFKKLDF